MVGTQQGRRSLAGAIAGFVGMAAAIVLAAPADAAGSRLQHLRASPEIDSVARKAVPHPDGSYLYTTGGHDDSVVISAGGPAAPLAEVRGPDWVEDLAVSPDGRFLYALSGSSSALFTYAIRGEGAELELVDERTRFESLSGLDNVGNAGRIEISGDGSLAFVTTDEAGGAVVSFSRDPATGALNRIDVEASGVDDPDDDAGTVPPIGRPIDMAISPSGNHLYASSERANAIVCFAIRPGGELELTDYVESGIPSPAPGGAALDLHRFGDQLVVSPDGEHLLAGGRNALELFDRSSGDGSLTYMDAANEDLENAFLEFDGDTIVASGEVDGYFGPKLVELSYEPSDGTASIASMTEEGDPSPDGYVEGLGGPPTIVSGGGGRRIYLPSQGSMLTFSDSPSEPGLRSLGAEPPHGLAGDKRLVFSRSGRYVFATASRDESLVAMRRDAAGSLTMVERELRTRDDPSDSYPYFPGSMRDPEDLVQSPHSDHVVVAAERSLISFAWDERGEELMPVDFERDRSDDESDPGGVVFDLSNPNDTAFSPDGRSLYSVSNDYTEALHAFAFDRDSGELSLVDQEYDGEDDSDDEAPAVVGMDAPLGVSVSPDGRHVYVASHDAISIFERSLTSGQTTFLETQRLSEIDSGPVIGAARTMVFAPDGRRLFVGSCCGSRSSLTVLARDPVAGTLRPFDQEREALDDPDDPGGPVTGASSGPVDLALTDDGRTLLAAAGGLLVFDVMPDGSLSFSESQRSRRFVSDGFDGAAAVALDASGETAAAAGSEFDSIATLALGPAPQPQPPNPSPSLPGGNLGSISPQPAPAPQPETSVPAPNTDRLVEARAKRVQLRGARVRVRVRAKERVRVVVSGRVKTVKRRRASRLRPKRARMSRGARAWIATKPRRARHGQLLRADGRTGAKRVARLRIKLIDTDGNEKLQELRRAFRGRDSR